jgi:predicted nucleotidyltransferase
MSHRTAEVLAAGRSVASRISRANPNVEVYLSGSICARLGTPQSDVDLYVVANTQTLRTLKLPPRVPWTAPHVVHVYERGVIVDVELRTHRYLRQLVRRHERFAFSLADASQISLSPAELDDTIRLFIGEVCGAAPLTRQMQGRLNADELRKIIIVHYAMRCLHLLRDVEGLQAAGDHYSAAHNARIVLLLSLQALLAGCGEFYIGDKWTWAKVARSVNSSTQVHLLELAFAGTSLDRTALNGMIDMWMLSAQACLCAAFLEGWDAPNAGTWSMGSMAISSPVRSRHWLPVRTVEEVLLGSCEETVTVDLDGLRLWSLCNGCDRGRVVEQMVGHLRGARASRTLHRLPATVERYLDKLVSIRVVE